MRKWIVLALILGISIILSSPVPVKAQEEQKESEVVFIPKQVKTVLEKGLENRTPRMDIPFEIFENLYLPAQQNLHTIFLFKAKNEDLGFMPPAPVQGAETGEETEAQEPPQESNLLEANLNAFLWFQQIDGEYSQETYVPAELQKEREGYDPQEESVYYLGHPLPPGKYILAMAVTSKNLEKIGTQYYEFELPSQADFTDKLGTTPIFFVREIQKMDSVETKVKIHEEFFTYSVLKVKPVLNNVFQQGDSLEAFFYVFGAQPNPENNKFSLTANYELYDGEELIVRYAEVTYDAPIISQPLLLKRTVLIRTKKGDKITEERKETRDVEPGEYTFVINIKDNITGKTLEKKVDITVEGPAE